MVLYVLYGWTGASEPGSKRARDQAQRTDALLMAVHADVTHRPRGPVLITGDLNGDLSAFTSFAPLLAGPERKYTDIGG